MNEVGRVSEVAILFPFEEKNTDNIICWRGFLTEKGNNNEYKKAFTLLK